MLTETLGTFKRDDFTADSLEQLRAQARADVQAKGGDAQMHFVNRLSDDAVLSPLSFAWHLRLVIQRLGELLEYAERHGVGPDWHPANRVWTDPAFAAWVNGLPPALVGAQDEAAAQ